MSGDTRSGHQEIGTVFDLSSLLSATSDTLDQLSSVPSHPVQPVQKPPALSQPAQPEVSAIDDLEVVTQTNGALCNSDRLADEVKSTLAELPPSSRQDTQPRWTARGIRRLVKTVGSKDPQHAAVLSEAIVRLGRSRDSRAFELVLRHIRSRSADVREAVVTALGLLGEVRCVPALLRCLLDRRETVSRQAVNSLCVCGDARAIRPLLAYGVAALQNRAVALEGIGVMDESVVAGLIDVAGDSETAMAELAVVALGRFETDAARRTVQGLIGHSQTQLCLNAITAFVSLADRSQCRTLHACLADPRQEIRRAAVIGLARLPHPANIQPLLKLIANKNESIDVLLSAAEALGATESPDALEGLYELLDRNDPVMHQAVAGALGRVGADEERAGRILMKLTQSSEPRIKFQAVVALARLKDSRAMPILVQALEDDKPSIRRQAVVALSQIEAPGIVVQIGRRLRDDTNSDVRAAAARALGKPGHRSAIRLLERALNDDVSVRTQAVSALAGIGDRSVVPLLRQSVADPAPEVRCQAIRGLAKLKVADAVEQIAECLDDSDALVVRSAEKALRHLGADRHLMGIRLQQKLRKTRQTPLADFLIGLLSNNWTLTATLLMGLIIFGFRNLVDAGSSSTPTRKRGNISRVAFGPDGTLAVVTKGGWLETWDVETQSIRQQFKNANATDAAFRNAEHIVVSTSTALKDYALSAGPDETATRLITNDSGPIKSLIVTPSHCFGLQSRSVVVANVKDHDEYTVRNLPLGSQMFQMVAAPSDGTCLFGASTNGLVFVMNVASGERLARSSIDPDGSVIPTTMDLSPDGRRLVHGTTAGLLYIRHLDRFDESIVRQLPGGQRVRAVEFLPDSKTIVIADDAPAVSVWAPDSSQPRRLSGFDGEQADTISVSPDGRTIAIGSDEDNGVWILNVDDGALVGRLEVDE